MPKNCPWWFSNMNALSAETIDQSVAAQYNCPVVFTQEVFNTANTSLIDVLHNRYQKYPQRAIVAIDEAVACAHPALWEHLDVYFQCYGSVVELAHAPLFIDGGDAAKDNVAVQQHIHEVIYDKGLCQHSYVIAIGGGAVQEVVGGAAASAKRGIRFVRIPTTVLTQCDAAIGVKNGADRVGGKNCHGTFSPPYAVINDFTFLSTLKERDWRAGIAEAVKVALIKDGAFFQYLSAHAEDLRKRNMQVMQAVIHRCASLHLEHSASSNDSVDINSSTSLTFGHWSAHKLEQLTRLRLRHGEAVAIGMALDSTYSHLIGKLSFTAWKQILRTLETVGFSLFVPELVDNKVLQELMESREPNGVEPSLTLLDGIGKSVEARVDFPLYMRAIAILQRESYNTNLARSVCITVERRGPSLGHLTQDL